MLQQTTMQRVQMAPTAIPTPVETLPELKERSSGSLTLSGLVYCGDAQLLCVLERALDRFKLETTLAVDAEEAAEQLGNSKFDVAILDFEDSETASKIVRSLRSSKINRDCTVIAIAGNFEAHKQAFKCGANFTVPRMRTADEATRCIRSSYFLILRNKRASVRFPMDETASVYRNKESRSIAASVKNLSETGLKIKCKATLTEGEIFEVDFQLPNGRVNANAQAVWMNPEEDEIGCKFVALEGASLKAVQEWINTKLLGKLQ